MDEGECEEAAGDESVGMGTAHGNYELRITNWKLARLAARGLKEEEKANANNRKSKVQTAPDGGPIKAFFSAGDKYSWEAGMSF